MAITKAIIPVAGLGTRFLPATLAVPKVMMPIIDRPAIHYAIEEAHQSGIKKIIFVISQDQESVKTYFQQRTDIEDLLLSNGLHELLETIKTIRKMGDVQFITQPKPRGLGDAILQAKNSIGNESFAVILPDDLILSDIPTLLNMIEIQNEKGITLLAVKEVDKSLISRYGVIKPKKIPYNNMIEIETLIEKPEMEFAPSNLAIVGRYILNRTIFPALENSGLGALGEIQLTDSIRKTTIEGQKCIGFKFPGKHFDIGTPTGLLKASIQMSLVRNDTKHEMGKWLRTLKLPE